MNGEAIVKLDPVFSHAIHVSPEHPMKVFIQPEGDSDDVYVFDITGEGFRVKEINGGQSTIPFSCYVVANHADDVDEQENINFKHGVFVLAPRGLKIRKLKKQK